MAWIGIDFVDAWGNRRTSFQWLNSRREAVAIIDYINDTVDRVLIAPGLKPRADAIHRLARIAINQHRREHSAWPTTATQLEE